MITLTKTKDEIKMKPYRLIYYAVFAIGLLIIQACDSSPKTQDITLSYLIKDNTMHYDREDGSTFLGVYPKFTVSTTITNTSDYGGVFGFYAKVSSQGNVVEFNQEQFIPSGQTVTFTQTKEIEHYSFQKNVNIDSWGIIAPTKTINLK